MFEELQKAVDLLESMQVDMMIWKKKEKDKSAVYKLHKYENCIDVIIDIIEQFDAGFDENVEDEG